MRIGTINQLKASQSAASTLVVVRRLLRQLAFWVECRGNSRPNVLCLAMKSDATTTFIADLGRKYIWWDPIGDDPHSENRILAQAMDLGTLDDTLALEQILGHRRLVDVMLRAEPGWLSDRSWEFWRGRLSLATGVAIPEEAPRRALHAAEP